MAYQNLKMFANSAVYHKDLLGENIKVLTGNSLPRRQHPNIILQFLSSRR